MILERFGFSEDFLRSMRIHDDEAGRAVIPFGVTDYEITINSSGQKSPEERDAPMFNEMALTYETAYICFSVLDALSIEQAGGHALAINEEFERDIREATILPDRMLIIAPNGIEAAMQRAEQIVGELEQKKREAYIVQPPEWVQTANDLLQKDPKQLAGLIAGNGDKWIESHRKRLCKEYEDTTSAAAALDGFFGRTEQHQEPIPTGYKELDTVLGGGLYTGLYCIGASSSFGKTTYALQMAEQISAAGYDVLFFSLEMSRDEMLARALSRYMFLNCSDDRHAKSARDLLVPSRVNNMNQQEKKTLQAAFELLRTDAAGLWIEEGIGDIGTAKIREAVTKHKKLTGRAPVVFIDYLQILQAPDVRMTDKQAVDSNVFELKRLSREIDCPIIAISSFNRDNYTTAATMAAFKESGAIDYTSDVMIAIQPAGMKEGKTDSEKRDNATVMKRCKRQNERDVEIVILKNRHGETGRTIAARYYAVHNHFDERSQRSESSTPERRKL